MEAEKETILSPLPLEGESYKSLLQEDLEDLSNIVVTPSETITS